MPLISCPDNFEQTVWQHQYSWLVGSVGSHHCSHARGSHAVEQNTVHMLLPRQLQLAVAHSLHGADSDVPSLPACLCVQTLQLQQHTSQSSQQRAAAPTRSSQKQAASSRALRRLFYQTQHRPFTQARVVQQQQLVHLRSLRLLRSVLLR
jgi:hypothetical protein